MKDHPNHRPSGYLIVALWAGIVWRGMAQDAGMVKPFPDLTAVARPEGRIQSFCIDFNWGANGPNGFPAPGTFAHADPAVHYRWYRNIGVNVIQTFCVSCNGYASYRVTSRAELWNSPAPSTSPSPPRTCITWKVASGTRSKRLASTVHDRLGLQPASVDGGEAGALAALRTEHVHPNSSTVHFPAKRTWTLKRRWNSNAVRWSVAGGAFVRRPSRRARTASSG